MEHFPSMLTFHPANAKDKDIKFLSVLCQCHNELLIQGKKEEI